MTYTYFKGYKAKYDYDRHDWFYEDNGESATKNPRPCKRCGHHSVKDNELEYDYCLGNLGENVTSACCGHGVKQGYILFKDGRMFIEKKEKEKTTVIDKDFVTLPFNRNGELHEEYDITCSKIHIEVEEHVNLSQMCKDLLEILKKKDVFSIYIVHPILNWGTAEIEKHYFDLETIEKIIFDEYYLIIEGEYFCQKIFYNAIFDFGEAKRW